MDKRYTYDDFMKISNSIDRLQIMLPLTTRKSISHVQKKIKVKPVTIFDKPSASASVSTHNNVDILSNIYKYLNKITDRTYDKLEKEIIALIVDNHFTDDMINEVSDKILIIITNNSFYCKLYAKLYNSLIKTIPTMTITFNKKIAEYLEKFEDIKYVSPNENYDDYCSYIKQLESIKNFTTFYVECLVYNNCTVEDIMGIYNKFMNNLTSSYDCIDKLHENESYADNIYIIVKTLRLYLTVDIIDKIKCEIASYIDLDGPGKNMKIKFKMKDTIETLDN